MVECVNNNSYELKLLGDYRVSAPFNVANIMPYLSNDEEDTIEQDWREIFNSPRVMIRINFQDRLLELELRNFKGWFKEFLQIIQPCFVNGYLEHNKTLGLTMIMTHEGGFRA